jgi:hypothetical protein
MDDDVPAGSSADASLMASIRNTGIANVSGLAASELH